ncbi:histidine phosphatase family protein [Ferdinandcohnia sp. Marseille-Q9671]
MELTLIRHLPTEWNRRGVLQGSRDIPILEPCEADIEDIEKNKTHLEKKGPFSIVVTSSLIRTQQTAHAYGYEQYQIEPLLNELHFGEFEGKEKKRLIESHKEVWYTNPRMIVLGEKVVDLEKRMLLFLQTYSEYDSVLVFGHGSWMRACMSHLEFGTINKMNQIEIKNNQLETIKVREGDYQLGRHHI